MSENYKEDPVNTNQLCEFSENDFIETMTLKSSK